MRLNNKELEEYKNPIKYFKYANKNVTEENKQLKDNWNKLKELTINSLNFYKETDCEYIKTQREFGIREAYRIILGKMQELEGSDSNDSN